MPTDAADVCSWGKTGSDRRIGKPTRLTQSRHRGGGTSYEIAKAKATQMVVFARRHRTSASLRYPAEAISTGRQKAAFVRFCEVAANTGFV
jgi:hypothetical protein